MSTSAELDRRGFLKLGFSGAVLLSMAGLSAALTGCASRAEPPAPGYRFLRAADVTLLSALLPALVEGAELNASDKAECLRRIDSLGALLGFGSQKKLRQLFDLLNTGFLRRWTTGVHAQWPDARLEEIRAFLQRWRDSSWQTFNGGYRALSQLGAASYYSLPAGWRACGYPGPLSSVYAVANS